jgi:hypothetical protein
LFLTRASFWYEENDTGGEERSELRERYEERKNGYKYEDIKRFV